MNVDLSSIQNNKADIKDLLNEQNLEEHETKEEVVIPVEEEEEIELSAEDIIYKNKLISNIKQYYEIFKKFLIDKDVSNLEERNIQDLEKLLMEIKDIVSNRNIKQNIDSAIQSIPIGIEFMACSYTPLKLNGFSQMLLSNEEFFYNCHEIILEYELLDNIKTKPEFRLGYQIILSAMLCHKMNSIKENNINLNGKVPDDIKSKFNNL